MTTEIRWPAPGTLPGAFTGTTLQDWLPACSVFEALELAAAAHGERTALAFLPNAAHQGPLLKTRYGELVERVARAANLLRGLGVGPRDVAAYMLPALPETHYVLWGAETAGIALPINPLLSAEDIAALLRAANAKVLIALGPMPGVDLWAKAQAARALAPCVRTLVRLGGGEAPDADIDFAPAFAASAPRLGFAPPALDDAAAYFHTGGTTGTPRLAVHTHRNQLAAAYGGAAAIGATPADVMLNGLPLFHVAATIFGTLSMWLAGAQVVVLSPLGLRDAGIVAGFWRIAAERRATLLGGVPTAFAAALAHGPGGADLSAMRASVCGAALTPPGVAAGVERITGQPLREVYGMTECGGVICVDPVWTARVPGSAGLPIPFCEVQARRLDAGRPAATVCAPGEAGVLVVRGPQVTPGYVQGAHDAALFTDDGWLVTGDLGRVQEDGRVFITGRAKDLIIRSGHNIDPAAIEDCLRAHPAVADAAAVGLPDAYAGEVPVAYVALKPGADASPQALLAFAAQHIAERPALPRWVRILDALPLTAVGKPFKPALRRAAALGHFQEVLCGTHIGGLDLADDPHRGRMLTVRLPPGEEGEAVRRAVLDRLSAYAVVVEFSLVDFDQNGI